MPHAILAVGHQVKIVLDPIEALKADLGSPDPAVVRQALREIRQLCTKVLLVEMPARDVTA